MADCCIPPFTPTHQEKQLTPFEKQWRDECREEKEAYQQFLRKIRRKRAQNYRQVMKKQRSFSVKSNTCARRVNFLYSIIMQDRRELIKAIVEAVGPPIDAKNETVLTTIRAEIKASEKKVVEKIDASQKDTIEALSTVIHEGHSDHENRIRQLEQDHKFPHSH